MFQPVEEQSEVSDLMKFLLFKLKEKDMTIAEVRMQKFIYKIKKELGEEHELFDSLPYYWYYHGPFSELVKSSFKHLTSLYCTSLNNTSFILKESYSEFENSILSNFPEINKIANKVLKDRDFFYENFIKSIYKEYAPYEVMYPFRYGIFKTADKQENPQNINIDKYVDLFYDCESLLPEENIFMDFSDIFSQFTTNLDLINDSGNFNDFWIHLREPIKYLWKTFASGVRVKHKDKYYNAREKKWNQEFNSHIKMLNSITDKTEEYLSVNRIPNKYSDSQKKILNSTLGSYLRG